MTLPEALARVERLRAEKRQAADSYDGRTTAHQQLSADAAALTLLLAEAHRAQRLREALESIANSACCGSCQEAALVARSALTSASTITRCDGRYLVPSTSPPREEPFDVTYRCGLPIGHAGPHAAALETMYAP